MGNIVGNIEEECVILTRAAREKKVTEILILQGCLWTTLYWCGVPFFFFSLSTCAVSAVVRTPTQSAACNDQWKESTCSGIDLILFTGSDRHEWAYNPTETLSVPYVNSAETCLD